MNHSPTPWKLTFVESLPFGYQIHDANGELVVAATGICTSSKQRNREDHRNGVGFKWDGEWSRESAMQAVAEQEATARYIVASANACKGNSTAWLDGYGQCLHAAENAKPLRANLAALTAQRDELRACLDQFKLDIGVSDSEIQAARAEFGDAALDRELSRRDVAYKSEWSDNDNMVASMYFSASKKLDAERTKNEQLLAALTEIADFIKKSPHDMGLQDHALYHLKKVGVVS